MNFYDEACFSLDTHIKWEREREKESPGSQSKWNLKLLPVLLFNALKIMHVQMCTR